MMRSRSRPLIISDCDGVLLEFIAPFSAYLGEVHGLTLRMESFALTGNVRDADGTPIPPEDFPALLDGFFTTHMTSQTPVPGVVDAMQTLAQDCDIIILTNVADNHAITRTTELARFGMPFRVIGNQGPKGAPIRALIDEFQPSMAVFIDDLPPHHSSARKHAPHVHRLHMVAELPLRTLIPTALDADARIDDWDDALIHIQTILKGPQ